MYICILKVRWYRILSEFVQDWTGQLKTQKPVQSEKEQEREIKMNRVMSRYPESNGDRREHERGLGF